MDGSDVLLAICEVSIAFAGFTSIVGVLGQRSTGHWNAEDSFRLWLMIESSLATLFFSLLPFSLHYFSLAETVVWGVSSGVMATFLIVHLIIVSPKLRVLDREGQWSTRRFEPITGAIMIAILLVLSLNALDMGFHRSFGAYLLGLILFLGLASMHFVALLVAIHSSNSRIDER